MLEYKYINCNSKNIVFYDKNNIRMNTNPNIHGIISVFIFYILCKFNNYKVAKKEKI